jgi:hypothetical protein
MTAELEQPLSITTNNPIESTQTPAANKTLRRKNERTTPVKLAPSGKT